MKRFISALIQPYHTLFRTFVTPLTNSGNNTISIINVSCNTPLGLNAGTPYYKDYYGSCPLQGGQCLANTKSNEYGCTFGDTLGFEQGADYVVGATYIINHPNLFLINGSYYVKFVAYSANNHVDLKTGSNFFVSGGVVGADYPPNSDVVIYIPYKGNTAGFEIITQPGFEFGGGSSFITFLVNFIVFLIPLFIFIALWVFFGRQRREPKVPHELMGLPNEQRKPWEVSAYFSPPVGSPKRLLYPTLMLDFYRRKIIDVKYIDKGLLNKKTLVKINNDPGDLDDIESSFLKILNDIKGGASQYSEGDYFDVNKAAKQFSMRYMLRADFMAISKQIKDDAKPFVSMIGMKIFTGLIVLMFFASYLLTNWVLTISSIVMIILVAITQAKSPLLVKYDKDFYEEYEQWTAFKNGLSHMPSMKSSKADAVVLWEKYLVYATALGVAEKVLKQFEGVDGIDAGRLRTYSGVYIAGAAFSTSVAGGSGGGGGVGGGGAGGGGGGGR